MSQYEHFAAIYDTWMQTIDYAEWWQYLATTFSLTPGMNILELGCGTGNLTEHMLRAGLKVVASDTSSDMLAIAEAKLRGFRGHRLLQLDMRRLPSSLGKFDAVIAACDVVNYLRNEQEVALFLRGVQPLLKSSGMLLFDVHGKGRVSNWQQHGDYNRVGDKSCYLLRVNVHGQKITQHLTGFVQKQNNNWQRFDETHRQTFYSIETLQQLLIQHGYNSISFYAFGSTSEPTESSYRLQVSARH